MNERKPEAQRFRVEVVHGESTSLFHVMDTQAPEDEQPCVVATYHRRDQAEQARETLERLHREGGPDESP